MKAHQRIIREQKEVSNKGQLSFFPTEPQNANLKTATVKEITTGLAEKIILEYEWLGTMPPRITRCYGIFFDGFIGGALVFAKNPGDNLVGYKNSIVPKETLYLARGACLHWTPKNTASKFISEVARNFLGNCTILAYADETAGEIGTIYQSLNWFYLGKSSGGPTGFIVDGERITAKNFKRRNNFRVGQGIEDIKKFYPDSDIVPLQRKRRYIGVYGDKRFKKKMVNHFNKYSKRYPKRNIH